MSPHGIKLSKSRRSSKVMTLKSLALIALAVCATSCGNLPNIKESQSRNSIQTVEVAGVSHSYWTLGFRWRCNADGGGVGQDCSGQTIVPKGVAWPADSIHCRTSTTLIKRDPGTTAGWKALRDEGDILRFLHNIRAQSGLFGAGREIEVAFEHIVIARKDESALKGPLACTFSIREIV